MVPGDESASPSGGTIDDQRAVQHVDVAVKAEPNTIKLIFEGLKRAGLVRGVAYASLFTAVALALIVAIVGAEALLWQSWIPALWKWGTEPITWRLIPALVAEVYLVGGVIFVFPLVRGLFKHVFLPLVSERPRTQRATDLRATLKGIMEKPKRRGVVLALMLLGEALALVLVGVAWLKWIPAVWAWMQGGTSLLLLVPGSLAVLALALLPPALATGFFLRVIDVLAQYVEAEKTELHTTLAEIQKKYVGLGGGSNELVKLMQYANDELAVYFELGRSQARKSFRFAMLAMGLGFMLLIGGLAVQFAPLPAGVNAAAIGDVENVLLGSGAVIEFIAVMFLWMYRSTMGQLTYFFDRQMYRHDVLACQWMATHGSGKTEEERAVVKLIVEKVLDRRWKPERPPIMTRSKGAGADKSD